MAPAPPTPTARLSGRGLTATLAGVLAMGLLVWFVHPLHDAAAFALHGDTKGLRTELRGLGAAGVLVLYAVMAIHAIIPYPAEIPTTAAGFVYGFAGALPLMLLGWVVSGLLTYAMGRYAARPLLHRLAGQERFERAEDAVRRGGASVLIVARLVPVVPFSLTGYVAGAAGVPVWRFAWTTAVGFLPLTLVFTLLGSRLESLSVSDPLLYLALAPVVALLLAARPLARKLGGPVAGSTPEEEPARR